MLFRSALTLSRGRSCNLVRALGLALGAADDENKGESHAGKGETENDEGHIHGQSLARFAGLGEQKMNVIDPLALPDYIQTIPI